MTYNPAPGLLPGYATQAQAAAYATAAQAAAAAAAAQIYQPSSTLFDAYANKANGSPVSADSGQLWYQYPASGDPGAMVVIGGKLTNAVAAGVAASYQQCNLGVGNPIGRIAAKGITFSAYSTANGSFTMSVWKTLDTGAGVPDSNLHLALNPTTWIIGTWAGGVFTQRKAGTFATPLTADGVTAYEVDAVLDGTTVYVFLPDGSIATDTNAAYGATPGTIASFEVFATQAATDTKAAVTSVLAEPVPTDLRGAAQTRRLLKLLATLAPFGGVSVRKTAYWQPAGLNEPAIPAAETAIDTVNLRTNFIVGASGGAVVTLEAPVKIGAAADVYWGVRVGVTGYGTVLAIHATGALGITNCTSRLVIPAGTFTPGATVQLDWTHFTTVTNAGTVLSVQSGLGRMATMTVDPL